jgi:hypothetical protein
MMSVMKKTSFALALLVLAGVTGCAGRTVTGSNAPTSRWPTYNPESSATHGPDNLVPDGYTGRFRVAAMVLENQHHGPQLCIGPELSQPPQCDNGPNIPGWSWNGLEHQSVAGTTWGFYVLIGTFDGRAFTLTEPAKLNDGTSTPSLPSSNYTTPCAEPAGGWKPVNPATATNDTLNRVIIMVKADPDFAGLWLGQKTMPTADPNRGGVVMNDPTKLVLNVRFTKDLARHEAQIRQVWGGALCLSTATHSMAELTAIQNQFSDPGTSSMIDEATGTIDVKVYVATLARQRELDQRYGPGLVHLHGIFEPID